MRTTAVLAFCTRDAGISNNPDRKAIVTMPFRVRVSFQPNTINRSAIHPPIGSLAPNTKYGRAEKKPARRIVRWRTVTR